MYVMLSRKSSLSAPQNVPLFPYYAHADNISQCLAIALTTLSSPPLIDKPATTGSMVKRVLSRSKGARQDSHLFVHPQGEYVVFQHIQRYTAQAKFTKAICNQPVHEFRPETASSVSSLQRDPHSSVALGGGRAEIEADVPQEFVPLFVLDHQKENSALGHRLYCPSKELFRSRGRKVLDERESLDERVAPQVQEFPLVG